MAVAFAAEMIIFFGSLAFPVSQDYAAAAYQQGRELVQSYAGKSPAEVMGGIFGNNFGISLRFFIPVLGWAAFGLSILATGRLLAGVQAYVGVPWYTSATYFVTTPHSWLEFLAYAIAMAQGVLLVHSLLTKRLSDELRRTTLVAVVVACILLLAAALETISISLGGLGTGIDWLILAAAGGFGYLWVMRKAKRGLVKPGGTVMTEGTPNASP